MQSNQLSDKDMKDAFTRFLIKNINILQTQTPKPTRHIGLHRYYYQAPFTKETFKDFPAATSIEFGSNADSDGVLRLKAFCTLKDSEDNKLVTSDSFATEDEFIELLTKWLTGVYPELGGQHTTSHDSLEKRVQNLEYISNRMLNALTNIAGLLGKLPAPK